MKIVTETKQMCKINIVTPYYTLENKKAIIIKFVSFVVNKMIQ